MNNTSSNTLTVYRCSILHWCWYIEFLLGSSTFDSTVLTTGWGEYSGDAKISKHDKHMSSALNWSSLCQCPNFCVNDLQLASLLNRMLNWKIYMVDITQFIINRILVSSWKFLCRSTKSFQNIIVLNRIECHLGNIEKLQIKSIC